MKKISPDTGGLFLPFIRVGGEFGSLDIKHQFQKDVKCHPTRPWYRISKLRNQFVDGINEILLEILAKHYVDDNASDDTAMSDGEYEEADGEEEENDGALEEGLTDQGTVADEQDGVPAAAPAPPPVEVRKERTFSTG